MLIGGVVRCMQKYQNWVEVALSIARHQNLTKVVLKNGTRIEAEEELLHMVQEVFFDHLYTPTNLPMKISEDDIVVDIGAHSGVFTIFASSQTRKSVYAFEPFPGNFRVLAKNVKANRLRNVIAQCAAVADRSGSAALLISPKTSQGHVLSERTMLDTLEKYQGNEASMTFNHIMPGKLEERVEVSTTTLQAIMDANAIERIGFLKLDCEGAEGLILGTTPRSYLRRIAKIAVEFHDHLSQLHHADLHKQLRESGFTTSIKWDGKSPLGYLYGWRAV